MDNTRILNLTIKFKERLRKEIENSGSHFPDKASLWKILVMAEIAHLSFALETNIEDFEKPYFDRQAAVGRLFCDWAMDWVAENYYEITNYVAKYYWPDTDKRGFNPNYVPFKAFKLDG